MLDLACGRLDGAGTLLQLEVVILALVNLRLVLHLDSRDSQTLVASIREQLNALLVLNRNQGLRQRVLGVQQVIVVLAVKVILYTFEGIRSLHVLAPAINFLIGVPIELHRGIVRLERAGERLRHGRPVLRLPDMALFREGVLRQLDWNNVALQVFHAFPFELATGLHLLVVGVALQLAVRVHFLAFHIALRVKVVEEVLAMHFCIVRVLKAIFPIIE